VGGGASRGVINIFLESDLNAFKSKIALLENKMRLFMDIFILINIAAQSLVSLRNRYFVRKM